MTRGAPRIRFRRIAAAACLLITASIGLVTPAAAADHPYELYMALDGGCIGVNTEPHTTGRFIVRDGAGRLRATVRYDTGAEGQHVVCPPIDGIHGGDQLRIRADDGWVGRWVVPQIEVRIDRMRDVVTGMTDPGRSLAVELWDVGPFGHRVDAIDGLLTPVIEDDGAYRIDVSDSIDLQGQDAVLVHSDRRGLYVTAIVGVPFMVVDARSGVVTGAGPAASRFTVSLVRDGVVSGVARVAREATGSFSAEFRDISGHRVRPRPGDRIVMPTYEGPVVRLPVIRAQADAASDIITGRCMPDAPYELNFGSAIRVRGRTDAEGRLRKDVTPTFNLRAGDAFELVCRFPEGDMVRMLARVP